MIKSILILLCITLVLAGCGWDQKKAETENSRLELIPEPDKDLREAYEQQQMENLKNSLSLSAICVEFSMALIEFKELLQEENYEVLIEEPQNDLCFGNGTNDGAYFCLPKSNYVSFFVKRKHKLEGMRDHWYPSFSVAEICFQDEMASAENLRQITAVIEGNDIQNEKNYDYLVQNGNRLIYVSCNAKIFEEHAFSFKARIEDIIKRNQ
ncbi:MAG: hypothetical protein AAF466_03175 [Bacteroidota bacterium]